ncbi:hypothetical protein B0H11DRAFT_2063116 [Mycena galericulata]|nr:hypothetical protein B0H11DRAFT_2063116 [Mycena galericulata]
METLSADLLRALPSIDTSDSEEDISDREEDSDVESTPLEISVAPTSLEDLLERLAILDGEPETDAESSSPTTSADVEPILPWQVDFSADGTLLFDYVYKRLVTENEQLILLGESPTRSLSIAFAVMRGSLTNIYATSRDPGAKWSRDDFLWHIEESRSRGVDNWYRLKKHWNFRHDIDTERQYTQIIARSMGEMACLGNFSLEADARKLSNFSKGFGFLHAAHKHVIFQCPWDGKGGRTRKLLQDTVHSVAEIQRPGDLLLFGLRDTSNPPSLRYKELYDEYVTEYGVPKLQDTAKSHGYEYLGQDKDLIQHCLLFGYHHWSETNVTVLHDIMLQYDEFVVYIFVKMLST